MGKLLQDIQKVMEELQPPNIAVIGRTGAGKSTLINAVFGQELAKTGTGLPVSNAFIRYPKSLDEKSPVTLYDSAGYEMGKEDKFLNDVFGFFDEKKSKDVENQIHLVWYVIHAGLKRFEHFDAKILTKLRAQKIPVLIAISQCDLARQSEIYTIEETIKNYESEYKLVQFDIIRIAANPLYGQAIGIKELVNKTVELLPELYTEAFIARQIVDLELKRKTAINYIRMAAAVCFAVGFTPIPFSTATTAITSQTVLCTKIASLYGYAEWAEIVDSVGGMTINSILTYIATSILDLISLTTTLVGGNIISGGVSGVIAASCTTILGLTYTSVFEKLSKHDLSGSGREEIEEFIQKTFKEELRKYSQIRINSPDDLEKISGLSEQKILLGGN